MARDFSSTHLMIICTAALLGWFIGRNLGWGSVGFVAICTGSMVLHTIGLFLGRHVFAGGFLGKWEDVVAGQVGMLVGGGVMASVWLCLDKRGVAILGGISTAILGAALAWTGLLVVLHPS
jgi:hypothetical protein